MDRRNLHRRLDDISKKRQAEYGSFDRNMKKIAAVWSVLLDDYLVKDIPGWMIPLLFSSSKLIRASRSFKQDNYDDAANYLLKANEMQKQKSEIENDEQFIEDILGVRPGQGNELRDNLRKNGKTTKGV